MEQAYYYVGFTIVWIIIIFTGLFLSIFLPALFWSLNDRYYTWLYQTVEVCRVYFKYRNKVFKDRSLLETVRDKAFNDKKRIFKKWHLNFIDKKLKEHDATVNV